MKLKHFCIFILVAWAPWMMGMAGGWAGGSPVNGIDPSTGAIYFGGVQVGALSADGLQVDGLTSSGPTVYTPTDATIASGAIAAESTYVFVDCESGTSDDLDTISSPTEGQLIIIQRKDTADTVSITNAGNIQTLNGGNVTLNRDNEVFVSIYNPNLAKWMEINWPQ